MVIPKELIQTCLFMKSYNIVLIKKLKGQVGVQISDKGMDMYAPVAPL